MAISASTITPTNSLEDFRIEFNNLVSDVTAVEVTNTFATSIIFEGATENIHETTLIVTDPTADRTITLPNVTGTITLDGNPLTSDGGTLGTTALEWSDLYLADGGIIYFGDDQDVTLTHVADTGVLLNSTRKIQFNDASQFIHGSSATVLSIGATDEIDLTATAVDLNGTLDVSGTLTQTGIATFAARPVFNASVTIQDGGSIGSTSDLNAVTISSGGIVAVTATTASTNSTSGALTVAGGAGVAADLSVGDDLRLISDATVLSFGADSDVTLTHVHNTGMLLNSTMKLQFNDASQFIHGSSATVLDIAATDEIELTATLIDAVGNFTVSGTIVGSDTIQGTTITATTAFVPDASDGAALGTTALEFSDLFLADAAVIYFGDDQDVTLTHNADTGLTLNSVMVATTFDATGDTSAGDNASVGYDSTDGLMLTGQGSTSDITLKNDANTTVFTVPTGTDDILFADNAKAMWGSSSDLTIYHDGSNSYINDAGTGSLVLAGSQINLMGGTDAAETMATFADNGAATLYYDNTAALATASGGGTLTGTWETTTALVPDASDGAVLGSASLEWSDLYLADAAVIYFGDDQDVTLTHVHDTGLLLNSTMKIQFNDASQFIHGSSATVLSIGATDEIDLTATAIDINGTVDISGTALITGVTTHGGNVISDTDSTDDLGTTGVRWRALYVDAITATDQITATGFTGTLDGILGSGAAAAATTTTLASTTITASGIIKTDDTTAATSTTDGSLQTDGGLSVALDAVIGDDIIMITDASVIHFGVNSDVSLTHVHDTGLLLNSTMKLQFNDASQFIHAPSATVLDIGATDEIELTATLIDVVGNLAVSGNLEVTGTTTTVDTVTMNAQNAVVFEGATADNYETTLSIVDPTADRTQYLINQGGYIPLLAAVTTTAITSTPEELNLLDGVSGLVQADLTKLAALDATAAEINLIDGGTARGTDAVASGDGILINDGGTMRMTNVDTVSTYFASHTVGGGNIVTTGALDSGSITSGFGAIDNGTSNIRSATITAETAFVPDASDGAALGTTSLEFSDIYLADGAVVYFGADQDITLTHAADTSLAVGGAGGTTGLIINNTAGDGDPFLSFALSGTQTFTMGVDDGDSDKFKIGTLRLAQVPHFYGLICNVAITGDLTVTGDDITMTTNTSGAALIADGTNFNPVVISGDATIATNGALTIASTAVEGSMLNNNVISGQTALTSGLAATDELMVSDAGTLKRVDVSLITDLATGDATALAIALG